MTRRVPGLILVCAAALLGLGASDPGTDFDAVDKRIQEAIEAGEITAEQGGVMMGALREHVADAEEQAYVRQLWIGLLEEVIAGTLTSKEAALEFGKVLEGRYRAAVDAGELTEEEAEEKYRAWTRERGPTLAPIERELYRELRRAVVTGEMTGEEAGDRWAEAMANPDRYRNEQALRSQLQAAVEAGRMTGEEARARFRKVMDAWQAREEQGD